MLMCLKPKVKPLNINKPRIYIFLLLTLHLFACSVPESTPLSKVNLSSTGVYSADIHAESQLAVVSEVSGAIKVHNLVDNSVVFSWRHHTEDLNLVDIVKFSEDGQFVVTADSDTFAMWNVVSGEPIGFWRIDKSNIRDVAIANAGKAILIGRADGSVLYFEPESLRRLEFLGHAEKINSIDIAANGRFALTGSNDYKAYLWDTESAQIIHVFEHSHRVSKVHIDQGARYIFTADSQDNAIIWDAQSGEKISQLHFIQRQLIFTSAQFSPKGDWLLTGSPSKRMALWDVRSGKLIEQWRVAPNDGPKPQSAVVYSVNFIEDKAVSIASSGNYEVWKINHESN